MAGRKPGLGLDFCQGTISRNKVPRFTEKTCENKDPLPPPRDFDATCRNQDPGGFLEGLAGAV